jgi:hypothetical protein
LNAFFKIFSNEEESLNYFRKSQKPSSAPPTAGLPSKTVSPTQPITTRQEPVPPPQPISTGHTRPITQITPAAAPPAPAPAPASNLLTTKITPPTEPGAPYSLVCAICKVKLTIPKPGSFKCPRCATFFKLFDDGKVTFSERKKASPLQMKLSCTDECMHGLSEFVGVLANRIGFSADEVRCIKDSIMETCGAVIEKAYENKQYLSYNVVLNPSSTDLKIQISDYGKFIYDDQNRFRITMQTMDEFEHKQHPKGGNIINMTKQVK